MNGVTNRYYEVRANGKTIARFTSGVDADAFIQLVKKPLDNGVKYEWIATTRAAL